MKRTVRFIEDDEGYCAGDFGDNGEDTMAKIASGDIIILGMVVFDADALSLDESIPVETRVSEVMIESLWCIDVESGAINDVGRDWDAETYTNIQTEYLRELAHNALTA